MDVERDYESYVENYGPDIDAPVQEERQRLVDPTPPGRGRESAALCSQVFCQQITGPFAVLIGAKPDKQGRHYRKILFVWYFPQLLSESNQIFKKLAREETVLAATLSNPDPKYLCMSCFHSPVDRDLLREAEEENDHDSGVGGGGEHLLKIVAASPTSLDLWHIAYRSTIATASIQASFTISLTHPPTALAWSEDGVCVFSAQRSRIMIWDDQLEKIGSVDSHSDGHSSSNNSNSNSTRVLKLAYLSRPKELIVAVYENGLLQGWALEEGVVCLSTMVSSATGRDQSSGLPYLRNDALVEAHVATPSLRFPAAGSTEANGRRRPPGGHVAKTRAPRHVGLILPTRHQRHGAQAIPGSVGIDVEPGESVFVTIVACFQSGRTKKLEVEIHPPAIAMDMEVASRVREVAAVDLARELRYRQSSLPSGGEDIVMKREQPACVLSISPLETAAATVGGGGAATTVGYVALLSDSLLVLNQNLVVLDLVATGFKGLVSYGSVHVPPPVPNHITTTSTPLLLEAIAVSALTSIAYAIHCPLAYLLSPTPAASGSSALSVVKRGVASEDGLALLASQLSLGPSLSANGQTRAAAVVAAKPVGPAATASRPPRGPSMKKLTTTTAATTGPLATATLSIDPLVAMVELDFFAELPASPSLSPLRDDDDDDDADGDDGDDDRPAAQTTLRRKSLSLLASPNSSHIALMTNTLQKQQQQQQLARTRMKGDWEKPLKDAQGRLVNQPVTFHTRIKSSGYGQQPQDLFTKKMLARQKEKDKEKKLRSTSAPRLRPGGGSASGAGSGGSGRLRLYPLHCQPMQTHLPMWDYPDRGPSAAANGGASTMAATSSSSYGSSSGHTHAAGLSPIFHMAFSSDATKLALATASSVALCLRLPRATTSQRDVTAFMGHNHALHTVAFSYHKQPEYLVLTASKDETARLWKATRSEQASILFSHHRHQPSTDVAMHMTMNMLSATSVTSTAATSVSNARKLMATGGRTAGGGSGGGGSDGAGAMATGGGERNRPFGSDVKHAQFYYQDRFVLLTHKSTLGMYTYHADGTTPGGSGTSQATVTSRRGTGTSTAAAAPSSSTVELTRFLHHGSYRRKHAWELPTSITALAAMNSVQSPLILTASSDKSIHVLDANCGRILRSIPQAHEKAITCLAVSQPSPHAPLPRDAHQVFLSMAPDNVVCLWDLRQATAVLRYTQHVHRREVLHGSLSPCMKYFGTGSEDRTGRLFDMVAGKECAVLTGHRDVVTCVAFNPLFAQIATASYDGTVRFYADADCPLYISGAS